MAVEIRPLHRDDQRAAFQSGDDALDLYFHRYAGQHQFRHHIGVTYVAAETTRILGLVDANPGATTFYEAFGFATVTALQGLSARIPAPLFMYLPLGAVPQPSPVRR